MSRAPKRPLTPGAFLLPLCSAWRAHRAAACLAPPCAACFQPLADGVLPRTLVRKKPPWPLRSSRALLALLVFLLCVGAASAGRTERRCTQPAGDPAGAPGDPPEVPAVVLSPERLAQCNPTAGSAEFSRWRSCSVTAGHAWLMAAAMSIAPALALAKQLRTLPHAALLGAPPPLLLLQPWRSQSQPPPGQSSLSWFWDRLARSVGARAWPRTPASPRCRPPERLACAASLAMVLLLAGCSIVDARPRCRGPPRPGPLPSLADPD